MVWLPVAAAFFGLHWLKNRRGNGTWCYDNICWLEDKSPECEEELRRIRTLARSGSYAYRMQPHTTVAAYLNRSFIRSAYRGRSFYVERSAVSGNRGTVFVSFDDSTHMAFELERPCIDCERDLWVVRRYAYLDENPRTCCG